jgi:TonB-dependent starch-binding outer membrane protein SusC
MRKIVILSFISMFMLTAVAWTQGRNVTGRVTSAEDGQGIPGASVVLKGTSVGTVTDFDGMYSIAVPSPESVLVYSFVGMEAQEIVAGNQSVINVTLQPALLDLDEVVVVGYGTRLKSELTGSISQVRAEDIANTTQPSFESAIQGRTAGVYVQGGSGKMGQAIKVRVRGSASVSASNQPLYVVDGFPIIAEDLGTPGNEPINPMADLNPADIESIQILKDASAAAIYGSRAANGVVLITTKRGLEGRTSIDFTTQMGFSEPANRVGFLNREQYLDLFEIAYENAGKPFGPNSTYEDALDWGLENWREGSDVNWEDQALKRGNLQQYDLSARGGTANTRFYAALSFVDQEGILLGNEYDRISGRLNLDQTVSDKLAFGMNLNFVRSESNRVANDNAFSTPLQMIALPPLDPTHDPETGELNRWTVYENGLIPAKYNNFDQEVYRSIGNVFANYSILPGLQFRSEWGVDVYNQREIGYQGRLTNDGGPTGVGSDRTVTMRSVSTNNYLTYDQNFGNVFDMNLTGGMSFQDAKQDVASVSSRNFPNDQFRRLASASEISFASSTGTRYSYVSYFTRANLKFFDRYLLTLSGRVDGSSRFSVDNRYGFFPAASAAWILTNEDFMDNVGLMSFLKLRASWGVVGNSEIGNFQYQALYGASNYAGLSGMIPTSVQSPDLRWETTYQTDIGLDFGFIDNRITGEIDYYVKNTEDLLLSVNLPGTTGFNNVTKNVGNLRNEGWEFVLNTVNLTGDFQWNSSFNIAFNKNEVTNLDGQIIQAGINRAMEGQPLGVFYTRVYAGVDQENGDALFYTDDTRTETTNSLSAAENQVAGDPNPDFLGGFTNTFRYKGFDLNVMFQFVYGNEVFNAGRQWQADGLSWFDNQTIDFYENFWKEPGDNAKYPQPRWLDGNGYGVSSMLIFDGSYVRLKDATLGYTLPANISSRVNLNSARIFVKGLNLLTWTEYPGWDPEANFVGTGPTNQTQNLLQGRDFYTAPQPRSITFGVTLGL